MTHRMARREFLGAMTALAAASAFPCKALLARERLYPPMDLSHFDTPITPAPSEIHFGYAAITWGGNDRQAIDDIALGELTPAHRLFVKRLQHAPCRIAGIARSADGNVIAARIDHHAEPALDQRKILAVGPHQRRGSTIVVEGDHHLGFGRLGNVAVVFAARREGRRIRGAFRQGLRLRI